MAQKVALVHDYLREYGGAERVLEALHELYPDAPVFTAFIDQKALGLHWQKFTNWDIRQTWLASIPGIKQIYSPLRVLAPKAFSDLDLSEYDLVISSSNAYEAKAVTAPNGIHVCYCHTPPRALYGYSTMTDWKKNPVVRVVGALINHYMRVVDFKVAQNVDYFIANSLETQKRITKFYRRKSVVIFPPVDVPTTAPKSTARGYYLYVNRLAYAKHPDFAVAACSKLGVELRVVGSGPMLEQLKKQAGSSIYFEGAVTDERLHELYEGAKALLYPVEDEDFGIVPIEAMGHGVPVIAHNSGGPKETIIADKTGVFFDQLSVAGLLSAIDRFEQLNKKDTFSATAIHRRALTFSKRRFLDQVKEFCSSLKTPL